MSLKLSRAFIRAIECNSDLLVTLGADPVTLEGARIFPVARPDEDEKEDKLPYIIIMPNGIQSKGSKDNYDETDTAIIGVLVVTDTADELFDLTQTVRETIDGHITDDPEFSIDDYTFSADPVKYDSERPCYFQTLTYTCNTQN